MVDHGSSGAYPGGVGIPNLANASAASPAERGHAIGVVDVLVMGKRNGVSGAYWLVAA
jgi:hypothetical protein